MRLPRRERWSIIGAILQELERELAKGDQARVTNVATRANLPYDRLVGYLGDLEQAGMIRAGRMPVLTEKGRAFLREYRQWTEVLQRFGLDPAAKPAPRDVAAGDAERGSSPGREPT